MCGTAVRRPTSPAGRDSPTARAAGRTCCAPRSRADIVAIVASEVVVEAIGPTRFGASRPVHGRAAPGEQRARIGVPERPLQALPRSTQSAASQRPTPQRMFNILPCSIKLNRMTDRTQQTAIEHLVARSLSEYSVELSVHRWTSEQTAIATVSRQGFRAEYQLAWLPHATLSELSRLARPDEKLPLLVASSQISDRTADALAATDVDYIDSMGNAHLAFGPVFVHTRGQRRLAAAPIRLPTRANLFSAKRMQVLFVLLAWPDLADKPVRRIATSAGTSVGITQSTLEIMQDAGFLLSGSLHRRDELLDLWAAAYRGSLLPKLEQSSFSGSIEGWSPPSGYLISGESAVELIRSPQTLTLYIERFELAEAIRSGWQKSDAPNIYVRRKFWKEPDWAAPTDHHSVFGASTAPPVMIYADLLASKEPRQAEVARMLRKDRLV